MIVFLLGPAENPRSPRELDAVFESTIANVAVLACGSELFRRCCPWITPEVLAEFLLHLETPPLAPAREPRPPIRVNLLQFLDVCLLHQPVTTAVVVSILRAYRRAVERPQSAASLTRALRTRYQQSSANLTWLESLLRVVLWHEWRPLDIAIREARTAYVALGFETFSPSTGKNRGTTDDKSRAGSVNVPIGHCFSTYSGFVRTVWRVARRDVHGVRQSGAENVKAADRLAEDLTHRFGLGLRWREPLGDLIRTANDRTLVTSILASPTIEPAALGTAELNNAAVVIRTLNADPWTSNVVLESLPTETALAVQLLGGYAEPTTPIDIPDLWVFLREVYILVVRGRLMESLGYSHHAERGRLPDGLLSKIVDIVNQEMTVSARRLGLPPQSRVGSEDEEATHRLWLNEGKVKKILQETYDLLESWTELDAVRVGRG